MQRLATPDVLKSTSRTPATLPQPSRALPGPRRLEGPDAVLTERELAALRLLAAGQSNAEIAESLVVAMGTVKAHIQHIYRKVDAHSRGRTPSLGRGTSAFSRTFHGTGWLLRLSHNPHK